MAACTPQGANLLYGLQRSKIFEAGLSKQLPAAYRKFYEEWKATPTAVHFIPREGQFERDELTGVVRPIQNVPLPVIYPPEHNEGIWGGEGVVKGFQKREQTKRRVPHYWVPVLRRTVLHSQVLDTYMSVTVTDRTMDLIHESHGFDHYLLKTPACDLKSELALRIKRNILIELHKGCPQLADVPTKQAYILKEYSKYLEQYTPDEIDWYGLPLKDALRKLRKILSENEKIVPHKVEFRNQLIQKLKEAGIAEAQSLDLQNGATSHPHIQDSWISKINPFGKKQET